MGKKKIFGKTDWSNLLLNYIPLKDIPDEIICYYVNHYKNKGIPLNVKTIVDISKILNKNSTEKVG